MAISTRTLTGNFTDVSGQPVHGRLLFTPMFTRLVDTSSNVIYPNTTKVVELAQDGTFSVDLIVNNDSDADISGWPYRIRAELTGEVLINGYPTKLDDLYFNWPAGVTTDLADVVPASPPGASLNGYVVSVNGSQGVVSVSLAGLGAGNSATRNVGTTAGTVAAGDDSRIVNALQVSSGVSNADLTLGDGSANRKLVVKAVGAANLASLPVGTTGRPGTNGLYLIGSFTGGEDDSGGTDSSPHINSYHYQRAQTGSYGESLRHFMMKADAKAAIAWWFPSNGYDVSTEDPTGSGWKPQAWMIAHAKANDNNSWHNHMSWEVMSPSNGLTTRLEMKFVEETWQPGDPYTGVEIANLQTSDADLSIRASSGVLRVGGGNAYNKDILLSLSANRAASAERWKIRANSTTEAGSNVGTDFELRRYSDSGGYLSTPLFVKRSSGRVGINTTDTNGQFNVGWGSASLHGISLVPSVSPGNASAISAIMTATTDRTLEARVSGDATARLVVFTDGKIEIGDGGVTRDVNLYRDSANVLKTDDTFQIAHTGGLLFGAAGDVAVTRVSGTQLGINQGLAVTGALIGAGKAAVGRGTVGTGQLQVDTDGSLQNIYAKTTATGTGSVPVYVAEAFDSAKVYGEFKVTGDSSVRLRFDNATNGGRVVFGSGGVADVNLYRSGTDQLATDDNLSVGIRLGVGQAVDASIKVGITQTADAAGVLITNSVAGGNTNQAGYRFDATGTSATGSALLMSSRATGAGDSTSRYVVNVSGTAQYGDGTATRDVSFGRNSAGQLRITPTVSASNSSSVGGALNITNTASAGAGIVVYSAHAAPTGHLGVFRANNATFGQSAVYVEYNGTSNALVVNNTGTGASNGALVVTSTNTANSALQVTGTETGRGTVKITHTGDAGGTDANASAISVDLTTAGTAAQGIFVTGTDGPTTGNLIALRNNSRDDFVVKGTGRVGIGIATGDTPAGVVDVRQNNDSTVGMLIRAFSGASSDLLQLADSTGAVKFRVAKDGAIGFYGAAAAAKPTVTGSRGGNAALASLLTALATQGLITDSTTV